MLQIQSEIEEISSQNIRLAKEDPFLEEFDRSYRSVSLKLSKSLESSPNSIYQSLKLYFNGMLADEASAHTSAKNSVQPSKPDPREEPAGDAQKKNHRDQSDLLADLRGRLRQYEKAQAPPAPDQSRDIREDFRAEEDLMRTANPFRRMRPSEESIDIQAAYRQQDSDRFENSDDGRFLQPEHRNFSKPKRQTVDYSDSKYLYKDALKRNPSSKPLPRPLAANDYKYSLNRTPAVHLSGAPNTLYTSHKQLVTVKGPQFAREADCKRPNAWLFECMKTMNDLKSFRENVRSKLNHSSPINNKASSKLVSPRYKVY